MRIPHVISESDVIVYTPSPESLDIIGESERQIVSENFLWNENHVPPLADYCVKTISKNFERYPDILKELPCENRDYLLEILPLDLPLECVVVYIDDDYYWSRKFEAKYGGVKELKRGQWNWKNMFLEKHIEELIEQAEPQYDDEQFMDDILLLCQPYVKRLIVTELQVWKPPLTMAKEDIPEVFPINHIDFQFILPKLPLITEVDIILGMKKVGESFKWNMFEVSVTFFQRLGKALLDLKALSVLRVHRFKIEYPHCQALIQNIIKNNTLVHLDLSNSDLDDEAALCVAKFLMTHPKVESLNLCNNNIRQKGTEGIGFALLNMANKNFHTLNLRLNPLGRDGTMGILRAIVRTTIPTVLSLSGCLFDGDIPERMGQVIKMNSSITSLDISNNWFGEMGGDILIEALRENTTLENLDVRETDITPSQTAEIKELLNRNMIGVWEKENRMSYSLVKPPEVLAT